MRCASICFHGIMSKWKQLFEFEIVSVRNRKELKRGVLTGERNGETNVQKDESQCKSNGSFKIQKKKKNRYK